MRRFLLAGLFLALAGCAPDDAPTGPTATPVPPRLEASVVSFGITQIGATEDHNSAFAINDLAQIVGLKGAPSPSVGFLSPNAMVRTLTSPSTSVM